MAQSGTFEDTTCIYLNVESFQLSGRSQFDSDNMPFGLRYEVPITSIKHGFTSSVLTLLSFAMGI